MRTVSSTDDAELNRFEQLLLALGRRRPLRDPIGHMLEKEGLTPPQLHVIIWCGHDGALTMGELARRVCITEKAITGIIDRLERTARVRRERSPDDRRVVRVHLTRKGSSIFRKIHLHARERLRGLLNALEDKDRGDLFRILHHLLERLAGAETEPHTPPLAKADR